ncbi:MAG: glycosyltransferase family 39 protein [Planctomycetes bacterium]|nr:glycosyltransferase family 39 protein [Planctomycetota bacterium]
MKKVPTQVNEDVPVNTTLPRWRRKEIYTLPAILIFAFILRLIGIDTVPFWIDEEYTLSLVDQGLSQVIRTSNTIHPPGYALLALPFREFGDEAWLIRLPAVLGGLLGVIVAYFAAGVVGRKKIAPYAALLVACSIYHIYYSQEARGYSWFSGMVGLTCFSGCAYLSKPRFSTLVICVVSGIVAIGFHYLAAPSVAGLVGVILCARLWDFRLAQRSENQTKIRPTTWLAVGLILLILCSCLYFFKGRLDTIERVLAVDSSTRIRFDLRFLAEAVGRWSGVGAKLGWYLLPLMFIGVIKVGRRSVPQAAALLSVIISPFILVALIPWPHRFDIRYLMGAQIPILVLICIGLDAFLSKAQQFFKGTVSQRIITGSFSALILLQLYPAISHAFNPRKYTPALKTTSFGYKYIIQNSVLDTYMIRNRRVSDFETKIFDFETLPLPLPKWPSQTTQSMPRWPTGRLRVERKNLPTKVLSNPTADDLLIVFVWPWTGDGAEANTFLHRKTVHPGQGRMGLSYLNGVLPNRGIQFELGMTSARLELVDQYFDEVQDFFNGKKPRGE